MAERIAAQMRDEYGPTRKAAKAERVAMLTAKASASLAAEREQKAFAERDAKAEAESRSGLDPGDWIDGR